MNYGFLLIGAHTVGKILRIGLILITMVPFFYSLSFGDELARMTTPANSSNELIYGQWMLQRKGRLLFYILEELDLEVLAISLSQTKPLVTKDSL